MLFFARPGFRHPYHPIFDKYTAIYVHRKEPLWQKLKRQKGRPQCKSGSETELGVLKDEEKGSPFSVEKQATKKHQHKNRCQDF